MQVGGFLTPYDRIDPKIYPNPVYRGTDVLVQENSIIYDINGRMILRTENERKIDTESLSPGIYLVVPREGKTVAKLLVLG